MIGAQLHSLSDNLAGMAFFLMLAFIFSWIGHAKGYYSLPYAQFQGPLIALQDVISSFLIFILVYFLVFPVLISTLTPHTPIFILINHLATFLLTALFLYLYSCLRDKSNMLRIWKDYSFPGSKPIYADIGIGVISWVLAMPVVTSITYIVEILVSLLLTPTYQEQIAVKFLKNSLQDPITLFIACFSILIMAPFFEELLFRGFLLSYLRRKMHPLTAIVISSLIFALFHYSPSQSTENIVLITTLFTFGCYLGFIYEKTRSLFSSIVLHVTFNSVSVIRIIFTDV